MESVFHQRFRDYELIVVDDGSTGDTENVLKPTILGCDTSISPMSVRRLRAMWEYSMRERHCNGVQIGALMKPLDIACKTATASSALSANAVFGLFGGNFQPHVWALGRGNLMR